MIDLFPYVLTDEKAANTFFKEAEKCLNALIPTSSKTANLFKKHFGNFASPDDYEDLIQTCLATLWEKIYEKEPIDIEKIDGYISSIARYRILNQIYENSKPASSFNVFDLDDKSLKQFDSFENHQEISEEILEAANNYDFFKKPEGEKEVYQFSRQFTFVNSYKNASTAANETGVALSSIVRCLNHERKTAGGYIWLYSTDKICELMKYD